jgi:hypothetical protein
MDNYFNYFTEIEACFQRSRGTPTLLSTLDWALIESWKDAGIPLEAVCLGIVRTFEKHARRPRRFTKVNGLGYCTQQVILAAEQAKQASVESGCVLSGKVQPPPFAPDEMLKFLHDCGQGLERAAEREGQNGGTILAQDLREAAAAIRELAARPPEALLADLEGTETSLTAVEEKVTASLTRGSPLDLLSRVHKEVEHGIAPYRRTMDAAQIDLLHRQFLKKRLFDHYQIPRLSLFYL